MISFIAWSAFMVLILGAIVWSARRSRPVQAKTEDVASRALPEIGGIAEKKHRERFGCSPTSVPGSSGNGVRNWYPQVKKGAAKQA